MSQCPCVLTCWSVGTLNIASSGFNINAVLIKMAYKTCKAGDRWHVTVDIYDTSLFVLGFSHWYYWYWCYYLHTLRDSVSPGCRFLAKSCGQPPIYWYWYQRTSRDSVVLRVLNYFLSLSSLKAKRTNKKTITPLIIFIGQSWIPIYKL